MYRIPSPFAGRVVPNPAYHGLAPRHGVVKRRSLFRFTLGIGPSAFVNESGEVYVDGDGNVLTGLIGEWS